MRHGVGRGIHFSEEMNLGLESRGAGGENAWSVGWVCGACARRRRLMDKWPRNGLEECALTMEGFP